MNIYNNEDHIINLLFMLRIHLNI